MSSRMAIGPDPRGLRSGLQSLHSKLDAELEALRCALGVKQRRADALVAQVLALREQQARGLATTAGMQQRGWDAGVHAQSMRYLVDLARQQAVRDGELRAAEHEVRLAISDCVEKDRRLALVRRMREHELRTHTAAAERRHRREADLEWLARAPCAAGPLHADGAIE